MIVIGKEVCILIVGENGKPEGTCSCGKGWLLLDIVNCSSYPSSFLLHNSCKVAKMHATTFNKDCMCM